MTFSKILIANRGEIAIRIARAAADLEIDTLSVYSEDDSNSLHSLKTDESIPLDGRGVRPYLDMAQIITIAKENQCDAIHPGYGFLSENAEFARQCVENDIVFIGPSPETIALFGDKVQARLLAQSHNIPVVKGISDPVTLETAIGFFESLEGKPMLLKAVAGGGGRGMRIVNNSAELAESFARATSESEQAFGVGDIYVEELIEKARHIEVQIAGDQSGEILHFGDRDCSLQRRHQKLIEIAPAPALDESMRANLIEASRSLALAGNYEGLGTFEFLVNTSDQQPFFAFIEANARLQVEHTVSEEVLGVDLVQLQISLAQGDLFTSMGIDQNTIGNPQGYAIQARINMETMLADGTTRPSGGTLSAFDVPSGPDVRTDTFGYVGYSTNPSFDSLLAKVIAHSKSQEFEKAAKKTYRALSDFRIEGLATNISLLQSLLMDDNFVGSRIHTRYLDEHIAEILDRVDSPVSKFFATAISEPHGSQAGATIDSRDPLAVLAFGKDSESSSGAAIVEPVQDSIDVPDGLSAIRAPIQGTIVSIGVEVGESVSIGQQILVMEAMKMQHEITASVSGIIENITVQSGDTVWEDHPLAFVNVSDIQISIEADDQEVDLDYVRPDLAQIHERHAVTLDAARPDAVAKRRATGQRTSRENIDQLCDVDSFMEHGSLVLTPGTGLPIEEVIRKFPTDGMVTGVGSVNGDLFPEEKSRTVVLAYDYTVLAGTQGAINHPKTDRMLELAEKWKRPVVFFAEGGGGRAGTGGKRAGGESTTTQGQGRSEGAYRPLDTPTFAQMGRLSALVPTIGITSRYCFAGNASLLGCCDVIIATENSNIGMGGPALIEGGNLGIFRPEEIGPTEVQSPNGVIDILVKDEIEAVEAAKKYLSYFQGSVGDWECVDQRLLRPIIPENRLRIYDVREVIETLADSDSVLELRKEFGLGMVTAFIRIEGRPIGVLANNPNYLAGAIDSDGSDKAARFLQICDAFDIPLLVLCDTPGMMVGPEIEKTALVRHCSRLFVTAANITIPHATIVLRKAYGLGAQAMAGGSFKESFFAASWPTGEFGGMGLEGQVKLGFRNELEAIEDSGERVTRYDELVEAAYARGRAINYGTSFGVDDVIDPADSRRWISNAFASVPAAAPRDGKKRPNIDAW
jgi:acetyl/propionyl-CoA carboxylase alpha subunit/acetyl-CoA carboxylase carboxyltransferase component